MSRDSITCGMVERYSIKRTLLIEQSWVKSRGEVIYERINGKRDIDGKKLFESNVEFEWW